MRNIELKAQVDYVSMLNRINTLKPTCLGTLFQTDTYYLLGNRRLKIRKETNKTELIYYKRENKEDSKDSHYFIFKLNSLLFYCTKKILTFLFGIKKVIEKQRQLFIYKNTRIHLDRVKDLGEFLELETVVRNEEIYSEYQREQMEVISRLKIADYHKVAYSYSDLTKRVLPVN